MHVYSPSILYKQCASFRIVFKHALNEMGDVTKHGDEVEVISDSESDKVETNRSLQPLEGVTSVLSGSFFGFDADKDGQILVSEKRKCTNVNHQP